MKTIFSASLILIGMLMPVAAVADYFVITNSSLSGQAELVENFRRIEARIPDKIKESLKGPIQIEFKNLPVHGFVRGKKLILDQKLIADFQKDSSLGSLLNRTLLHELVHAYDFLALIPKMDIESRQQCSQEIFNQSSAMGPECLYWKHYTTTVSTQPDYLGKAGWIPMSTSKSIMNEKNYFAHRSPDEYELKNPTEHFAVNFEYFITDPQYKCRRPSLYQFLKNHFQHEPFANITCENTWSVAHLSAAQDPKDLFQTIDVSRLYKIDYLFASEGTNSMSKWGHSMIRLVICAPGKPLSDTCYLDTTHHLVLSYRAFVDTPEISTIGGLTGKYPSRVFVTRYLSVVTEYNKEELRDLKALPLNYSRSEMLMVVQRAIEAHWSYSGEYYFTNNNCATETFNLLRSSVNRKNLYSYNPGNPKELWNVIIQSQLADARYLPFQDNREEARAKGLLSESYGPRYKAALKLLGLNIDLTNYRKKSFEERQSLLQGEQTSIPQLASLAILEEAAYLWQRSEIRKRISKTYLEEASRDQSKSSDGDEFRQVQNAIGAFSAPYMVLLAGTESNEKRSGYGLPSEAEKKNILTVLSQNQKLLSAYAEKTKAITARLITEKEKMELDQTAKNLEQIFRKFAKSK